MKVLIMHDEDTMNGYEMLCVFREDDVAVAEFEEFVVEWRRLANQYPDYEIIQIMDDAIALRSPDCNNGVVVDSSLGTWAPLLPNFTVLNANRTFILEEVHAR